MHYEDPYVFLKRAVYDSKTGKEKRWAYIERTRNTRAVVVVPLIFETREVILIKQFRVPVGRDVIEFPAGLMEEEEDPGLCGLRELLEETGYRGDLLSLSPVLSTSAGLSSEEIYLSLVRVAGEPVPQELEDSEEIEVLKVPLTEAEQRLREWGETCLIDSKVWTLLGWLSTFLKFESQI